MATKSYPQGHSKHLTSSVRRHLSSAGTSRSGAPSSSTRTHALGSTQTATTAGTYARCARRQRSPAKRSSGRTPRPAPRVSRNARRWRSCRGVRVNRPCSLAPPARKRAWWGGSSVLGVTAAHRARMSTPGAPQTAERRGSAGRRTTRRVRRMGTARRACWCSASRSRRSSPTKSVGRTRSPRGLPLAASYSLRRPPRCRAD